MVSNFTSLQPGGVGLLQKYSIKQARDVDVWYDADWAFNGGLNNHSRAARKRMQELRVAYYNKTWNATGRFVDLH